jgi:hypothetical protein
MALTRKDLAATALIALMAACLIATTRADSVPLIGSSHRWAAAAILLLGVAGCSLGNAAQMAGDRILMAAFGVLGTAAFAAGVWALISGRLLAVELLVAANVVLWAATTMRHAWIHPHAPISA